MMVKTQVTNYKEVVEDTKQNIMRYIGTRFVESLDVGLPSITLNCELSIQDKEIVSQNLVKKEEMLLMFVEGEDVVKFGGTIKI
jgi:hypothetical protein